VHSGCELLDVTPARKTPIGSRLAEAAKQQGYTQAGNIKAEYADLISFFDAGLRILIDKLGAQYPPTKGASDKNGSLFLCQRKPGLIKSLAFSVTHNLCLWPNLCQNI